MQAMNDTIEYLFCDACPCGMPRDDAVFCSGCRAKREALLLKSLTIRLTSHVRTAVAGAPCRSCGDVTICGDLCAACRETGERVLERAA